MRSILCFYMGYTPSFNGVNYGSKKVYGSEITTIKLAEALSPIYNVYIFVNGLSEEDEIVCKGVQYYNSYKLREFQRIDIMIIVRYINFFIYYKNIAKKTFIWYHDVTAQPSYDGKILYSNGDNYLYNLQDSYEKIIVLSNYHLHNNLNYIGIPQNKYKIIPNMIDTRYYYMYNKTSNIIRNKFIYMSDISRGFDILLDCLIYIQKEFPDISLTVFRKHEFTDNIKDKIKLLNNYTVYGKESQDTIAKECLTADFFFYPTNFQETFCNCAVEAQLYECICIYNDIGSLSTTIDHRGLKILHNINDVDYYEKTCKDVINLMYDENKKKYYREKGHSWAVNLNTNKTRQKWLDLFSKID